MGKSHLMKLHPHPQKPTPKYKWEISHQLKFLVATGSQVTINFCILVMKNYKKSCTSTSLGSNPGKQPSQQTFEILGYYVEMIGGVGRPT
jgi:hypothetical protein